VQQQVTYYSRFCRTGNEFTVCATHRRTSAAL